MDSTFSSDEILTTLEQAHVRYTISVPFARFPSWKETIERRIEWRLINPLRDAFEKSLQPESWGENRGRRFLFVRQFNAEQRKEPLQLDLLEPLGYSFDFKVVITNRHEALAKAVRMHEGRGAQEGIFAELKSENALAYVPTKTWLGNRSFMCAVLIARNLTRELTMLSEESTSSVRDAKRAPLWTFTRIDTLRRELLQRAGRLIRPQGKLTFSMSINGAVKSRIEAALHIFEADT